MSHLTYKQSGVDICGADSFIEGIRPLVEKSRRPEVLGNIGGFGGLFALPPGRWRSPVLVAGTDGVGTKLKIAFIMDSHREVGTDLVAMCVNDIIVSGAEPLFFLDYFATGKLDAEKGTEIVEGIADGCIQAGCALLGGETAEMPGFYSKNEYDLAGFAVGIVERADIIDGCKITEGDYIIGLASSGLHSNGFSLARMAAEKIELDLLSPHEDLGGISPGKALLEPTRIYVRAVRTLIPEVDLRGIAHITGGGLPDNIPRMLPEGLAVVLEPETWKKPPVIKLFSDIIPIDEQYRVFNMGIGMIITVPKNDAQRSVNLLRAAGEDAMIIGEVIKRGDGPPVIFHGRK